MFYRKASIGILRMGLAGASLTATPAKADAVEDFFRDKQTLARARAAATGCMARLSRLTWPNTSPASQKS